MSKYTFVEFIATQEGDDFNVIEQNNLDWAKDFVGSMGRSANWIHEGDCTKQNVSCPLCVYELYLKEYREYYFSEEPKEETSWFNEYQSVEDYIINRVGDKFIESTPEKYKTASEATISLLESNWKTEGVYNEVEKDFIKRCIKVYWEYHSNRVHPDNQEDWNISQSIINDTQSKQQDNGVL